MRRKKTTDPWHYARPKLAGKYLQTFEVGLTSARALFAKRRMGKSEFLEQDLIPAAQERQFINVYLNLWDAKSQPATALLSAFSTALQPTGVRKLAHSLKRPLKGLKASAKITGLGETGVEADFGGDAEQAPISRLTDLIRGFTKPKHRMLLVLDEAQVLAEPAHAELAHSLRASLDGRKQNIKVIFAGSSEATLRRMFGRSTEPFYNWAPLEPFELLGEDFVRAMVAKVNRLSRYPLALKDALTAFESLKRTPEFFRRYLNRYLSYADQGAKAALSDTQSHVFNDANFINVWRQLLPADREVLSLIASGTADLFSEASRLKLSNALGLHERVTKNMPQQSLRRLQDADLVIRMDYGDYQLQDDAFAEWVRSRDLDSP